MAREKGMGNLQCEKSGRWTMRVGVDGRRYSHSTRTTDRGRAERTLQRFLAPFGLGEHRLPLANVWIEYVKSPNRNDLAASTLNAKRVIWMHFAKWMERNHLEIKDLGDITADTLAEYLACLRADLCASSYNARVCVLREMFRILTDKAGLDDDPWIGVRLRPDDSHSRRELTVDELHRLLAAAKRIGNEKAKGEMPGEEATAAGVSLATPCPAPMNEWHTLFLIGIYTGLRLGDCCRLPCASVNLAMGIIQLIPSKTKRHAHGRPVTIPIHPVLRAAIEPSVMAGLPYVLPGIAELYRTARWRISERLTAIFKAANIETSVRIEGRRYRAPEATFHSLRHTFVSLAANAGVPLHIVQSIVGHESTAMTRHYYHENVDSLRRAVDAIPALGNP